MTPEEQLQILNFANMIWVREDAPNLLERIAEIQGKDIQEYDLELYKYVLPQVKGTEVKPRNFDADTILRYKEQKAEQIILDYTSRHGPPTQDQLSELSQVIDVGLFSNIEYSEA